MKRQAVTVLVLMLAACEQEAPVPLRPTGVLTAGFVTLETVYNSELVAPYDVLHHSIFRDSANYIEPFVISPDGQPLTTFEGIIVTPHHSFESAPRADILVIPSTGGSMNTDLQNEEFMAWLTVAVSHATFVITVCDGAFPLAATGQLDGRKVTTFPADRNLLADMFPEVEVLYNTNFVVDGKFITSVGGALSYEPAFYLVEKLYGSRHAQLTAEGLVLSWNVNNIPHYIEE